MAAISNTPSAPLFLGIAIGILVSLCAGILWGVWRVRYSNHNRANDSIIDMSDDVLIGLLVLAAFAFGAFLTYVLLNIRI